MTTTKLCMVRHGETAWNAEKRLQGQIDIPLNARGQAQARATARQLMRYRFDAAYSSDLDRAWQTATAITAEMHLGLQAAPGLRERHYGLMQGLTGEESRVHQPEAHAAYATRCEHHDLGGGESLRGFADRVAGTLQALVEAHAGKTLLLVAHGGVLDVVYRLAHGRELAAPRDFPIPNAGLNWLEYGEGAWRILAWGEQTHLAAALDELTE